jgi:hypothetical protein
LAESDPVAVLAAQLEELRGRLARAEGEVGGLRARYEDETGPAMLALSQVKQVREDLDEAIEKRKIKPPAAPWWLVDRDQFAAQLADLRSWFDTYLARQYPAYAARLAPCWWRHMEAIWELSALKTEWHRIYPDPENGDNQALLNWHERWMPGVLSRLAEVIKCVPGTCQLARRTP